MLIGFVIIYLLFTIIIGWYSSRFVKNSTDFAIAGRRMPTYVVASGLFATWFGSETVMGASSEFVENGLLGVIEDPFGASLCLLLLGVLFVKPLYKLNILTFSDYYSMRYNKTAEWVSAIFMIPSYFGWIAAQLIALATVLQAITGLEIIYGVLICATVVVFYTYIGGMWAVSITDTIQTMMIIIGLLVLVIILINQVGGLDRIVNNTPNGFFRFIPKENSVADWSHYFVAWITIGLGSIPQQDVFQRILSAKTDKTAINGTYWSSMMYLTIAIIPLVIALCGKILYPYEIENNPQLTIPMLVLKHTNIGVQILFFGALLSAILSTCSGAILAPATVVGENLLKPLYGNKISDKKLLMIMRYSVILITIISIGFASWKTEIYELVSESSALSLVSLFVPLAAGLYWKKASALGAILSMVLGMGVWTFFEFFETPYPSTIWGLLASILGMIIGSYLKPQIEKLQS
ncbi:MAG: sodium:solute symporter family protein [Spirosomaceae bacterium]|nr:sodium:solute symporter family protein [Spirosomataceae bacterium]